MTNPAARCQCVGRRDDTAPHSVHCDAYNPHADFYAAKSRVLDALADLHATSIETAATDADLIAAGGGSLAADAANIAARGAEVKYRSGAGYWLGRTRNNGRA